MDPNLNLIPSYRNKKPHMDKGLQKAIMKQSLLKNAFNAFKCQSDWNANI